MRRIIELSRYVVVLPSLGALVGGLILIAIGLWEMGSAAVKLVQTEVALKESTVSVLAAVDTLLLATVLLVIGYGLYELFVDESLE
ncbi:MAG: YqhA family protein, partial [Actinomycetota bacterium]